MAETRQLGEQAPRPLFPLLLHGRMFACPATITANNLHGWLSRYMVRDPQEIQLIEKIYGGYNYIWNEREELSFSSIPWIHETIEPIRVVARRVVSLTEPVDEEWRLVCPISTSSVVTSSLFRGFCSALQAENVGLRNVEFALGTDFISKLEKNEEVTKAILGAYVAYPADKPIIRNYHRFTEIAEIKHRYDLLQSAAKSGNIVSVEAVVEGIPVLVRREGQVTIYRGTVEWEKLPFLISQVYRLLGGGTRSG